MSEPAPMNAVAIRLPADDSVRRSMEESLGLAKWAAAEKFLPKDDDELNAALSAGRFQAVLFADLDSLLEMMWKDEMDPEQWQRAGVHVDLVSPPPGLSATWHEFIRTAHKSLTRWRAVQRKRQIIAATILSATALLAMAALFWLIPPTK